MALDPAQRVFRWFEPEHRAAVTQERAVREAVSRVLPLVKLLIEQSEDRILEKVMYDTAELRRRLAALEEEFDEVLDGLESHAPAETLATVAAASVSPPHLGDIEKLLKAHQKLLSEKLHHIQRQVCGTRNDLGKLRKRFQTHIDRHSQDEDAADWWKKGQQPFGDGNAD